MADSPAAGVMLAILAIAEARQIPMEDAAVLYLRLLKAVERARSIVEKAH